MLKSRIKMLKTVEELIEEYSAFQRGDAKPQKILGHMYRRRSVRSRRHIQRGLWRPAGLRGCRELVFARQPSGATAMLNSNSGSCTTTPSGYWVGVVAEV
jgi:hypothetical protein